MYYLYKAGPQGLLDGPKSTMAPAGEAPLGGLRRAFVSEELMLIPEDTELPPDYVQE